MRGGARQLGCLSWLHFQGDFTAKHFLLGVCVGSRSVGGDLFDRRLRFGSRLVARRYRNGCGCAGLVLHLYSGGSSRAFSRRCAFLKLHLAQLGPQLSRLVRLVVRHGGGQARCACVHGLSVCGTGASKNLGTLRRSGSWLRVDTHGPATPHRCPQPPKQIGNGALFQVLWSELRVVGRRPVASCVVGRLSKEANLFCVHNTTESSASQSHGRLYRHSVRRRQGGRGMRIATA